MENIEANKVAQEQQEEVNKQVPKGIRWKNDEVFEIKGTELERIAKSMEIVQAENMKVQILMGGMEAIREVLNRAIADGKAEEIIEE